MPALHIRKVPEELLQSANIEAAAAGRSLRDWVLEVLAAACTSRVVREDRREVDRRPGGASKKNGRRVSTRKAAPAKIEATADLPDDGPEALAVSPGKPAEIKPCSHGLLFHPGCSDTRQ